MRKKLSYQALIVADLQRQFEEYRNLRDVHAHVRGRLKAAEVQIAALRKLTAAAGTPEPPDRRAK